MRSAEKPIDTACFKSAVIPMLYTFFSHKQMNPLPACRWLYGKIADEGSENHGTLALHSPILNLERGRQVFEDSIVADKGIAVALGNAGDQ